MRPGTPHLQSRLVGASGAAATLALMGLLLFQGFIVQVAGVSPAAIQLLDFTLPPPPPPPPQRVPDPPRNKTPKPKDEAGAPNLVSRATEIVAPEPVVQQPSPVVAAKRADIGSDATTGAAPVAGPGIGTGGAGNGQGGGGGGGSDFRLLEGDLYDDDYPEWAQDAGISGTVYFRVTIGVNGRVSDCRVTRSVGSVRLDELTCRLVKKRFRFAPSRDASGRPYVDTMLGEQTWVNQDRPGSTDR